MNRARRLGEALGSFRVNWISKKQKRKSRKENLLSFEVQTSHLPLDRRSYEDRPFLSSPHGHYASPLRICHEPCRVRVSMRGRSSPELVCHPGAPSFCQGLLEQKAKPNQSEIKLNSDLKEQLTQMLSIAQCHSATLVTMNVHQVVLNPAARMTYALCGWRWLRARYVLDYQAMCSFEIVKK